MQPLEFQGFVNWFEAAVFSGKSDHSVSLRTKRYKSVAKQQYPSQLSLLINHKALPATSISKRVLTHY